MPVQRRKTASSSQPLNETAPALLALNGHYVNAKESPERDQPKAGHVTIQHDWNSEKIGLAQIGAAAPTGEAGAHPTPGRSVAPGACMTVGKRMFDVSLCLVLLVPLSLVMAMVALLLLIVEGRPIFYVSERMRAPGEPFRLIKFRTMAAVDRDAGATGAHKAWRITRLGWFLRRTRIDELPQLFNILRGDMSFVGPRPPLREYVERFPRRYAEVLRTRPGVTGLATLIYHAHEDRIMACCHSHEATEAAYYRRCLPTKLRLDLIYQRRRTLALDLWIIMNTVMTVIIPGWKRRR